MRKRGIDWCAIDGYISVGPFLCDLLFNTPQCPQWRLVLKINLDPPRYPSCWSKPRIQFLCALNARNFDRELYSPNHYNFFYIIF